MSTDVVSWSAPSMGGRLEVLLVARADDASGAQLAARRATQRVERWAARLTRFSDQSDLAKLNADTSSHATVIRPTLAAVLGWAATASERSGRVVDVTMLAERLAAESGEAVEPKDGTWTVEPIGRRALVSRPSGVRFDLDGVAKGWIADRAADLLQAWTGAAIDADGDISLRAGSGVEWRIAVDDPRPGERPPLATLCFASAERWSRSAGVATSGTSVHRWTRDDGRPAHHLLDPRTGRPAESDVVQATVVAASAREAEMLAKTALILGSRAALPFLMSSAAWTAVLLLESDELVALPGIERWLA